MIVKSLRQQSDQPLKAQLKTHSAARAVSDRRLKLKVNEIFFSLQGESLTAGIPTVFIRLSGCPLRCQYCDTAYAFYDGQWLSVSEVVAAVAKHQAAYVTVTGGEPLAQTECLALLKRLCDAGYTVSIETSGALDISAIDERVVRVMDLKTPASGESHRNRWDNIQHLRSTDQVKFVICNRVDYDWAKTILSRYALHHRCTVLFSPAWEQLEGRQLAEWILADHIPVRLQLQLHKLLWGETPGR